MKENQEVKEVKEVVNENKEEPKLDTSKLHIYTKIQRVRVELQKMDLKKTGYNKFSDFLYFELSDFLPQINELCMKYNLFTYEDITTTTAKITVIDCDKVDEIFEIVIPTAEVELKGANKIQSLGGLLTYARKYLYMLMFEIVEGDILDATLGKPEPKTGNKPIINKPTTTKPTTTENSEPIPVDNKIVMKNMLNELSKNGKKNEVTKILMDVAGVKNPNDIKDENKILQILDELKKIDA
jgi:hypothetical protein